MGRAAWLGNGPEHLRSGGGPEGGQLQRVAIARAMLRDAPVLVLDEPTTGLDALAARQVIGPHTNRAPRMSTLRSGVQRQWWSGRVVCGAHKENALNP